MRRILALLVAGLLASSLAAPAAVVARSGSAVRVVPPTGGDDTAAIQAALDWCVAQGPGCTVQLQAGTYHTSQLVTYDFRGTFKGAGAGLTTIEAVKNALVNWPDPYAQGQCLPDLIDCRWPTLIIFVNGTIEVSDLALDFPWTNGEATTPYMLIDSSTAGFIDAFKFMGDGPTDVTVDRVSVTGRHDDSATSVFGLGFNVLQGIYFAGDLPSAPYRSACCQTYATLTGTFTVRNSSVSSIAFGIVDGGAAESGSRITIGGSPGAGNQLDDMLWAIPIGSDRSVYDVSYNVVSSAVWDGVFVGPLNWLATTTSQFFIHDNTLVTSPDAPPLAQGIYLSDDPVNPWIAAKIWHNTITVQAPFGEGIDANYVTGAEVKGNTVTGTGGYDAISLWGSTRSTLIANDVRGFTPDPTVGFAQIYLDPFTADNHVVCAGPGVTVLDQGTGNKVTGCGQSNSKGAGHSALVRGHLKPKLHP